MNLKELFELQRKLDEHIVKEKGLEGQDLLPKKILALQVELGELANCWRGFKYWSHNQKPSESAFKPCSDEEAEHYFCVTCHHSYSVEKAVDMDFICPTDENDLIPMKHVNPMLEEYVDCLHFILSIGNELGCQNVKIDSDYTEGDAVDTFNLLFYTVSETWTYIDSNLESYLKTHFGILLALFIGLGEKHLGFNWDEIEKAYLERNKISYE